jgi:hypothetical protein
MPFLAFFASKMDSTKDFRRNHFLILLHTTDFRRNHFLTLLHIICASSAAFMRFFSCISLNFFISMLSNPTTRVGRGVNLLCPMLGGAWWRLNVLFSSFRSLFDCWAQGKIMQS